MIPAINQSLGLSGFTVVSMVVLTGGFSSARREMHRAQETRLKEAVSFLRAHCDMLEKLEDDAMPEGLLRLALDVSHLCLDPDASAKFRDVITSGEYKRPQRSESEKHIDDDEFLTLAKARPDLAAALVGSLVTGLIAFEKRWPECAGVFGQELLTLVTAPIEEARRVVDTARGMKFDWREIMPSRGTPAYH